LGVTYALARLLCERLNVNINDVSFEYFKLPDVQEKIKDMVFIGS